MTEEGIILRFEDTMKQEKASLFSFIKGRVNSEEDAEDIVQEIFSRLLEGNLSETIEDLGAWLFRAARNRIIDLYRKRGKDRTTNLPEEGSGTSLAVADAAVEWQTEFWDAFETALSELPAEQRFVFEQNELLGLTFREISEKTGEKINTLLSRKHYAVLFLRERLRGLYDEMNEKE